MGAWSGAYFPILCLKKTYPVAVLEIRMFKLIEEKK